MSGGLTAAAAPLLASATGEPSTSGVALLTALAVFVFGFAIARLVATGTGRAFRRARSAQAGLVADRLVFAVLGTVTTMVALHQAGVDASVLVGTAGIATVAIGFASQTSASNVISGVFLLAEQPFRVGDAIRVEGIAGEVVSIDLLSVKLRTFDNLLVRIPNETLLKSQITNVSHFPIRRLDVRLNVPYGAAVAPLREALFALASENPLCLDEPTPMVFVDAFEESSVAVQFSVWAARENFLEMKSSVLEEIQRRVYGDGFTAPYPVRVIVDAASVGLAPKRPADPGESTEPAAR
ncbi:MAG: mechanosensitive ion channel family protein [Myxococcales bacterium]|nr:mechanosensitive ion channel family protein [Myxococcales bacterium]MCB9521645.1 mechanosensitive ion channel family protein [Myxococcales bacterium]MCB9531597.1 mechanosensitive ion channel family protein [Myxococcales bacterium]MCB9532751.1 mechanosensitive ion channel family protein [Myxococcales bacterium]